MKIVICSNDGHDYFGGPYEWIKRLGPSLRDKEVEVVFLLLCDHSKEKCELYNFLISNNFECYALSRNSVTQWYDNTEDRVAWFVRKVRAIRPEVFVANILLEALYACQWIQADGISCVGVYHSDDESHRWYDDIFLNNEDWRVATTVFVSEYLLKTRGTGNSQMNQLVIGCGTSLIKEQARPLDHLSIIYVGKIQQHQKCVFDTYETLKKYLKNNNKDQFTIIGGGRGQKSLIDKISHDKVPQINYLGRVGSDVIQFEMAKHNVFILLSEFEGLPVALMEAMAVGLVPICYNIESGIPELIKHMETGIIVNNRGSEVHEALDYLKNNPDDWKRMSENAKELIRNKYSMEVISDKWLNMFDRLILKNKRILNRPSLNYPEVHPLLQLRDYRKPSFWTYLLKQYKRLFSKF